MSTIDHKAKAVKHIENVGDFNNSESNDWPLVNATLAQAHATLALVEEIRTATLSAVIQRDLAAGFGIPSERLEDLDRRLS